MDRNLAIQETLARLETRWLVNTALDLDTDFFGYQPLPLVDFMAGIEVVEIVASGRRFLEIGCGIGEKLSLMHSMGWEVSGFDWNKELVFAARELLPERADDIWVADVRQERSFDADVVYMWQLAKENALQEKVEAHVVRHCRPGTILFTPERSLELEQVGLDIWRR